MGRNAKKKGGTHSVGKLLVQDRFTKKSSRQKDTFLHTSELNDGYDWGRLNLQSVTESNQLEDFLSTAELANQDFTAEKQNIKVLSAADTTEVITKTQLKIIADAQALHLSSLSIPRRPVWNTAMNTEELDLLERQAFLEWRRSLAQLQEREHILITPYEKNLEFWRQLWRVVERSDIVVQIVDCRAPLLFRCEDLERWVKEVDPNKQTVILINKSDLLTSEQRTHWLQYFNENKIFALFWSAKLESERSNNEDSQTSDSIESQDESVVHNEEDKKGAEQVKMSDGESSIRFNSDQLVDSDTLISKLRTLAPNHRFNEHLLTIGLVGYPNVGKSSTINAILQSKKCSVSATPGKTKHFQTIFIDNSTVLCDCPGLVMPSFVSSKAEMILNGILPIDQMRDHKGAINLLAQRIPRVILEHTYNIQIRKPGEGEDPDRPPTDLELLNVYGSMRGYMTAHGTPDNPRSARYLLKDYVMGKLLYCQPPPGIEDEVFKPTAALHDISEIMKSRKTNPELESKNISSGENIDVDFFNQKLAGFHIAGRTHDKGKPTRHKKKEKSRRVYAHLDKHDAY